MDQNSRAYRLVRSAIYMCRVAGEKPSATRVTAIVRAATGQGIRRTDVCAAIKAFFAAESFPANSGTDSHAIPGTDYWNGFGTDFLRDRNLDCDSDDRSRSIREPILQILKPFGDRSCENGNLDETGAEPFLSTDGTGSEPLERISKPGRNRSIQKAEHHARVNNLEQIEIKNKVENAMSADAAMAPAKAQSIETTIPEVSFDEQDEARVQAVLALEITSDKMRTKTRLAKRFAMRSKLDAVGEACWRYGMDTAIQKPAGWNYAVAVMRAHPQGAPRGREASSRPKVVPKSCEITQDTRELYARLGRSLLAVPEQSDLLDWVDPTSTS